ncbi:hypothetical protein EDD90_9722 [Streptomyces sp. Ag109_O5-1]|nr:hypothetical protein EDD90_9722 [Streptomyces sp. Ag109_O5-1]
MIDMSCPPGPAPPADAPIGPRRFTQGRWFPPQAFELLDITNGQCSASHTRTHRQRSDRHLPRPSGRRRGTRRRPQQLPRARNPQRAGRHPGQSRSRGHAGGSGTGRRPGGGVRPADGPRPAPRGRAERQDRAGHGELPSPARRPAGRARRRRDHLQRPAAAAPAEIDRGQGVQQHRFRAQVPAGSSLLPGPPGHPTAVPCPSPATARRPRRRPAARWTSSDTTRWTSARSRTAGRANRTPPSASSPTAGRRPPDRGPRNRGSGLCGTPAPPSPRRRSVSWSRARNEGPRGPASSRQGSPADRALPLPSDHLT